MQRETLAVLALGATLLSGCSSAPRQFTPVLATPPADRLAYEEAYAECQQATANLAGKRKGDIAVNGAGTAAVGGTVVSAASWGATAAAGAVAVVGLPVAGLVWGISKSKRAKKERRIKEASSECLSEQGYLVAGWLKNESPSKADRQDTEPEAPVLAIQ